jgi:hypothetical protein
MSSQNKRAPVRPQSLRGLAVTTGSTPEKRRKGKPEWQALSPTTAWGQMGVSPPNSGSTTPTGSPKFRRNKKDPRQKILLRMTYLNLALGVVMIVLYVGGPSYPGHFGTVDDKYNAQTVRHLLARSLQAASLIYQDSCPSTGVREANNSILHSALITGAVIWLLQPVSYCFARALYTALQQSVLFLIRSCGQLYPVRRDACR